MEMVIDACAIMAVIANEPECEEVIEYTRGAVLVAPYIVSCEVANALTKMMKRGIIDRKEQLLRLYSNFCKIPFEPVDIDERRSLAIAWDYKIYIYDAMYLEIAQRMRLPLLTYDNGMCRVGVKMGIPMIGGYYASN